MNIPKIINLRKRQQIGLAAVTFLLIAGGVAFALLQSQAKLNGNSIETDSASLVISPNDITYSNAATGYKFAHIIPGVQASQTEHIFLRNMSVAPLALKVGVPTAPDNPDGVDLSKVKVILSPYDMSSHTPQTPQSFSLQSLISPDGSGAVNYPGGLSPGAIEEFDIQIAMDADAVNGSAAALSNLDFVFTGTAASNTN